MEKFRITVASLPDRERPVAEIYYDNMYWVQVSQETDDLSIQFYSHPKNKCWEFEFDKAIEVLKRAERELLGT
jgi:hypothetical protein